MASSLSGGQRRRLSVAISILGNPKVVFLDEPSSGLDPVARMDLWNVLKEIKSGRSIIITTHQMNEVDDIADRTIIMQKGQLVAIGASLYLKSRWGLNVCIDSTVSFFFISLQLGYSLTITTEIDTLMDRKKNNCVVDDFVLNRIPKAHLVGHSAGQHRYRISFDEVSSLTE